MIAARRPPAVILVTGAHGLLGSRVVPLFLRELPACRVIATGRGAVGPSPAPNVEMRQGDLREASCWSALPTDITHVVHLAARLPWGSAAAEEARLVADNLIPLAHLIEQSRRWPALEQVIYGSSVSVYAPSGERLQENSPLRPATAYAAAKLAGESLIDCLAARGVRTVALRLSSLYARGQYAGTVLPRMVQRAVEHAEIEIYGDGSRTQDFLHCEDAARAVLLGLERGVEGVFNVGCGTPVTLAELAAAVNRVFAVGQARITHHPGTAADGHGIKLDISRAQAELGYRPRLQIVQGLERLRREMAEAS
jgi:nucleoside-diphosphate-sugar epimerase